MTNNSLILFFLLLCTQLPTSLSATKRVVGHGYKLVSLQEFNDVSGGLVGLLELKKPTSTYGPDIPKLKLFVKHEREGRLRVHITDAEKERWEVPYDLLPRERPLHPKNQKDGRLSATHTNTFKYPSKDLTFSFTRDPFGFAVQRTSTGEVLFNSTAETGDPYGNMVFKDQYLEITTRLPKTAYLYGLGENTQPGGIRIRPNDPCTIYTTDISAINLNMDLYGAHPMYMDVRGVGSTPMAHSVLLLNSNGMDVVYRGDSLTYKVIGGVFDFYFFGGPTPLGAVDQYTSLVGRPAAMPYWSLGFHQCRWGYHNVSEVDGVVEGYNKAGIPLDVIWTDDDHMDAAKDFTLDPKNFPRSKFSNLIHKAHSQNMRYIVLIDPGIAVNRSYGVFRRGISDDVFIKYEHSPYLAQVWPGPVYFPDFLNPRTLKWWTGEINRFLHLAPLDGLWVDMNEPSNFCTGKCQLPTTHKCPVPNSDEPWICCLDCKNATKTRFDDPPYKINASGIHAPLASKTIVAAAEHYNGVREYDAHSLYGFTMARATHNALRSIKGTRPFVLTRSTFVGAGKYAAHWTGDNKGTWNDLRYSISTMLNFGIFGVPMVGSDICGFYPAPTEELCNRWIELGAFYPFSRDHANYYSPRQELYVWDTVAKSARNALGLRYKLLPYLYTLSYEAHTTGAPIARPLFFSFPDFVVGYELSTQFLLGRSVMVSPVLKKAATVVKVLFPPGTWYSLFDLSSAVVSKNDRYHTLEAPLNEINVHVFEGTVLPMQRGGVRSHDARRTPFTLVVAFGFEAVEAEAEGEVFVDNDEATEMKLAEGKATYVEFKAKVVGGANVSVWSKVRMGEFAIGKEMVVERVRVLGLKGSAGGLTVKVDGKEVEKNGGGRFVETTPQVEVERLEGDAKKRGLVVDVSGLKLSLGKSFAINWRMELEKN